MDKNNAQREKKVRHKQSYREQSCVLREYFMLNYENTKVFRFSSPEKRKKTVVFINTVTVTYSTEKNALYEGMQSPQYPPRLILLLLFSYLS